MVDAWLASWDKPWLLFPYGVWWWFLYPLSAAGCGCKVTFYIQSSVWLLWWSEVHEGNVISVSERVGAIVFIFYPPSVVKLSLNIFFYFSRLPKMKDWVAVLNQLMHVADCLSCFWILLVSKYFSSALLTMCRELIIDVLSSYRIFFPSFLGSFIVVGPNDVGWIFTFLCILKMFLYRNKIATFSIKTPVWCAWNLKR